MMVDLTKDPKWVRRALAYFDSVDRAKRGVVTLDHFIMFADGIKERCEASDEEISQMKDALRIVYTDVGFTYAGMKREDFPKKLNDFASRERERKKNNEDTFHTKLMDANFNIIDKNKDCRLSLDELKIWVTTIGMPEDAAQSYLLIADTNKNGTIELNELRDAEFKFWFEPIDNTFDNLYGGYFSGNQPRRTPIRNLFCCWKMC